MEIEQMMDRLMAHLDDDAAFMGYGKSYVLGYLRSFIEGFIRRQDPEVQKEWLREAQKVLNFHN
jgi:hypothetical protein